MKPIFPIYIPSKGRAGKTPATKMFDKYGVPYRVIVEPQDHDNYAAHLDPAKLITLPDNNRGLVYARNFIKDHAVNAGAARHWQFDDDVRAMRRMHKGHRIYMDAGMALAIAEQFTERYTNIALTAFNEGGFLPCNGTTQTQWPPFRLNYRCYTCFLMRNDIPNRWRHRYNEDTDMTLQVLGDGWCTVLMNTLQFQGGTTNYGGKVTKVKGGQQQVYAEDGRLKMARDLERVWPGVVTTRRRWGRPQHKLRWAKFDTKLIRRDDIDWDAIEKGGPNEFGMTLKAVGNVKAKEMQRLLEEDSNA